MTPETERRFVDLALMLKRLSPDRVADLERARDALGTTSRRLTLPRIACDAGLLSASDARALLREVRAVTAPAPPAPATRPDQPAARRGPGPAAPRSPAPAPPRSPDRGWPPAVHAVPAVRAGAVPETPELLPTLILPDPTEDPTRRGPPEALPANVAAVAPRPDEEGAQGTLPVDAMLSHFKIRGILGKGGMGVVYRALDLRFNREIALKTILGAADPETVERFVREAKAAGRLKHPNIVPVFEHGVVKGVRYMALELVEGKSLLGVIRESGPMSPSSGASTVRDLAEAVAEAHAQGVLHRDLKPANVLLDKDSRPRLTDFGLARDERETDLTQTGDVLGTPVYMAPEQALGDKRAIGPATDVYGLGAILYEALAGQPPFTGRTGVEVLRKVVEEEPPSPTAVRLGRGLAALPPDLETICQKCLEKAPERRYASARELARDLRSFLDGEPIAARPATRLERARRFVRRNRVVSALAGFLVSLLLLVAVAAVVAIVREHLEHQRETRRVAEVVVREQETLKNARLRALHMWFAPGLEDGARGQLYSSMGNLRAAAEEYARLAGPRDERAASGLIATYRSIGETLLELGDGEAAVVLLRKAGEPEARIDSAREQHRLYIEVGQANAYGDAGEYAQSEELLTRLLVAHPNLYWALAYRGCQRNLTNDPRGALSDLTEALHLAKEPCCHLLLECSRSRYLLGDLPGAERDCDAALKLEPDYYPAFVSRANVRRRLGDYPGALRDAIEARRVPDARRLMPEVDIVYAESLWQTGEREKGEAEMTRVLDRPGMAMRMPHVHWFRSKMRAARGDRTGAIEDLRAFLAVIDKGPDADDARAFLATLESGH